MIELKVTEPVNNYDGSPLKEGERELLVRDFVQIALNQFAPGEQPSGDEKERSFRLTMQAYRDDVLSLSIEDAAFLKERAGKILSPIAYGQLLVHLEGDGLVKQV